MGFSALMVYDWLLTLEDERRLIWHRKLSFVSWILLANRMVVPVFLANFALSMEYYVCGSLTKLLVLLTRA